MLTNTYQHCFFPSSEDFNCPSVHLAARAALAVTAVTATNFTTILDDDWTFGLATLRTLFLDELDDVHTLNNLAEDHVLAVQVRRGHGAQEELRAVGVWPRIGHGQHTRTSVLVLEVLIAELLSVDRLSSGAIAFREVPALAHEAWNHAVERAPLEMERLALSALALLTGAECSEVFCRLWHVFCVQLHFDAAARAPTDLHLKEHSRV
mmetsp:Transcript_100918/g.179123  ORF Transcript_100918/g.179123 Transcript_100918/m.179123 type:complete len:208 (-) Transcript_100918:79-702(-)